LLARRVEEGGKRCEFRLHVGRKHEIERADGRDGGEILDRIVRQRAVDRRADRISIGHESDGAAVRRLREHRARRRDAAWPGLILHDEALSQFVAELLGGKARGDVGHARRAEGQDEADRPARVMRLRPRTLDHFRQPRAACHPSRGKRKRKLASRDRGHHTLSSITLARTSSSMSRQI